VGTAENGGSVTVQGVGAAGPGQTTVVDCRLGAGSDENLKKICVGQPQSSGKTAWDDAKRCEKSPVGATIVRDLQGKPWGYENDASCAFRDEKGQPIAAAAQAIAQSDSSKDDYEKAPVCSQGGSTVKDQSGRLWGYENGKSCKVKA
jgi:hypothetical protein